MNIFRNRVDVFDAINRCDWQKVKDAVVPGKANLRDPTYEATLLHWTVNEGHLQTVEHLLSCGADVRARDGKHSATPLHWAGAKGHVFVVRLLMMQEADVNSRDSSNRTPLHWAAGNGQLGVIRELLFWGARVECTDAWKKVPLHWAAYRGHVASVEELVGRASPVNQVDADGNIPGATFHQSVPEDARKAIRAAMKRGPASGDSVVRAATVSSELLLETLDRCRSWGELFENRQFDQLSKECQDHRERLRGVIQGLADQGKAESLEPCLKAMDLLNSALGLHEDMRNGSKPVPLKGGSVSGRDGRTGDDSTDPPRAGGEQKKSEVLRDFLAPSEGEPPSTGAEGSLSGVRDSKAGPGLGPSTCSSAASLRLYQLPAVREACGGFDPKRCIGEGGFGKVYRGSMMGLPVAVKKLDETGLQGREQFFREVEVLSTCRHENIVPLLGVCMEPPCLVYRLMPNNSLRHHLDDPMLKSRLNWRLRVRMTMHMCSGLDYLHSESTNKPKVIHGDIKPENILLDEYLKARLSDFGISRVGESEAGVPIRSRGRRSSRGGAVPPAEADGLQGTFGYMDPVYQSTGRLDERSDVYSLGVVMLELLTGDPVHCPDKQPPGLVDRVRKALEDRALKSVVDRSAAWGKTAAKAYARLASACCAENPSGRPNLRDVLEKVEGIHESGAKSAGGNVADSSHTVDLLQLFDPVHDSSSSNTANGGYGAGIESGGGDVSGRHGGGSSGEGATSGASTSASAGGSSVPMQQQPPPPPPPPPYHTAIQCMKPSSPEPPPYSEAIAAESMQEGVGGGDTSVDSVLSPTVSPGTRVRAGDATMMEELSTITSSYKNEVQVGASAITNRHPDQSYATTSAGRGGERGAASWWDARCSTGMQGKSAGSDRGATRIGPGVAELGSKAAGAAGRHYHSLKTPFFRGSINVGSVLSGKDHGFGSVSCTRSTSLAEYGVDLAGLLQAARGGGALSSNARLLCVCCAGPAPEEAAAGPGASATLPPAEGQARTVKQDSGHVSVMDLWHRGRTVRYPAAADKAAMSPNQSESVIAVYGGGSLHVFSIPRRLRLQELAVAPELCMWRWLSPWGLVLLTRNAAFYWSVLESPPGGSPGNDGGGRGGNGGRDHGGEAVHEMDAAARLRRPRQAFVRRRTLTAPGTLHRLYDYQASADGRWGMLLCAVGDNEMGSQGGSALDNGYGAGGGPVKVDLYSFERAKTFEFEVLGAALMIMPGSNPPLNILALVIRGDSGAAELRVLDLDRSLSHAEGPEALNRLASHGDGWLIATTHVLADEDLRGFSVYRVVEGVGQGGSGTATAPLVSPPVFLRQWTMNTNVLFLVGCHGLLLLLDVLTGVELARVQACVPPVIEAEVDADVGDLVVVSTADGGGIHRLTVRAAALRESVEYDHNDPEMATRVSALTGYTSMRPLPPPKRQV